MPPSQPPAVDRRSGYCAATKIFHSLRPPVQLPPPNLPITFASFAFSLLPSPLPSHPALIDATSGRAVSFPAFLSHVRALVASLRSALSISHGDVAFVLAPALLDVPVLYFALLSIGAVVSPANPASTADEVSRLITLSNPSVAFAVSSTAAKLPGSLPTVLLDSPQFSSFLHHGDTSSPETVVRQSNPAAIMYSSGTTGRAKAVVLTQRNLMASTAAPLSTATITASSTVMMLTVPMFHVYGFIFVLIAAMVAATLVVQTTRFDARRVLAAVERFRVTRLKMAPPALLAIVRVAEEEGVVADASSLQVVNCGGAPLSAELIRRFLDKFPHAYVAQVVNPATGDALPAGMSGELWVRGPFVMKGYLGDKESTSAILDSDGWLRTGDICYIDNDGFLFLVDRLKDLIKYKGYQVAPAELEHLLQRHADIIEAAVVPYPDDQAGELPVAFVVRRPRSNLNEAQIMEFVSQQVAPFKRIRHVFFVDSIPKNAGGKILRKDLVKLASPRIYPKL